MLVVLSHNGLLLRSNQAHAKRDRQDQSVHRTCEYKQYCRLSEKCHDNRAQGNKAYDKCIFMFLYTLVECLQERH